MSGMPPLQLVVSHASVDVPKGFDRHVIYIDISWRGKSFRTTAKARQFDPMRPNAPLDFDTDQAMMTAEPPLTSDDLLLLRARHCDIFGDKDFEKLNVPIMALPLYREEALRVKVGPFTFCVKPMNFGADREPGEPVPPFDPNAEPIDVAHLAWVPESAVPAKRKGKKKNRKKQHKLEPTGSMIAPEFLEEDEGDGASAPPDASAEAAEEEDDVAPSVTATFDESAREIKPTGVLLGLEPPVARTDLPPIGGESSVTVASAVTLPPEENAMPPPPPVQQPAVPAPMPPPPSGFDASEPLEIHQHADALGVLTYTGSIPPRPPQQQRPPRGTPAPPASKSLLGSVFGVVKAGIAGAKDAVESTLMHVDFPELSGKDMIRFYTPSMLNGHGTPIEGKLFLTEEVIAFNGPMMRTVIPYGSVLHIRRVRSFSDAAIQIFLAPDPTTGVRRVVQLQGFDGTLSKIGSILGIRDEAKVADAHRELLRLWSYVDNTL